MGERKASSYPLSRVRFRWHSGLVNPQRAALGASPREAGRRPQGREGLLAGAIGSSAEALGRSQLGHVAIQASISLSSPVFRPSGRKLAVTELRANRAITSSLKPNVARRAS